jgi:hypothetical protein
MKSAPMYNQTPTFAHNIAQDLDRLRGVVRNMLDCIDESINREGHPVKEDKARKDAHERMFASKDSLVAALVTVAELMLKLEQAGKIPQDEEENSTPEPAMAAADISLVETFLQRAQSTNIAP